MVVGQGLLTPAPALGTSSRSSYKVRTSAHHTRPHRRIQECCVDLLTRHKPETGLVNKRRFETYRPFQGSRYKSS